MAFDKICYIEFELNEEMRLMEQKINKLRLKIEARRIELQKQEN